MAHSGSRSLITRMKVVRQLVLIKHNHLEFAGAYVGFSGRGRGYWIRGYEEIFFFFFLSLSLSLRRVQTCFRVSTLARLVMRLVPPGRDESACRLM